MFYATRLSSGVARISFEKPPETEEYIELETLPEGEGVLRFNSKNELYFETPTPVIEDTRPTVEDVQEENKLLKAQVAAQTERSDFMEDCVAEMATVVYSIV